MFKRLFIALFLMATPLLFIPASTSAVDVFNKDVCDRDEAKSSSVCKDSNITGSDGEQKNPLFGSEGIITVIVNLLTAVVAIIAVIIVILAGLKLVTSGTNPQDVSSARERIIYALVALAIAALAQAFVRFIVVKLS